MFTKLILTKLSAEGFEKEYTSYDDALQELSKYICKDCKEETTDFHKYLPRGYAILSQDMVNDYLATACGCEFMLEEIKE